MTNNLIPTSRLSGKCACEVCDHCMDLPSGKSYCALDNDHFVKIKYPDECDDFEPLPDDYEESW